MQSSLRGRRPVKAGHDTRVILEETESAVELQGFLSGHGYESLQVSAEGLTCVEFARPSNPDSWQHIELVLEMNFPDRVQIFD